MCPLRLVSVYVCLRGGDSPRPDIVASTISEVCTGCHRAACEEAFSSLCLRGGYSPHFCTLCKFRVFVFTSQRKFSVPLPSLNFSLMGFWCFALLVLAVISPSFFMVLRVSLFDSFSIGDERHHLSSTPDAALGSNRSCLREGSDCLVLAPALTDPALGKVSIAGAAAVPGSHGSFPCGGFDCRVLRLCLSGGKGRFVSSATPRRHRRPWCWSAIPLGEGGGPRL